MNRSRLAPQQTGRWRFEACRGRAGDLHGRPWPEPVAPSVWVLEVERPALVLGSTQAESAADASRLADTGTDLVRRRSGGGAVLVATGSMVWIDVLVPVGDELWSSDVGLAFEWLGPRWCEALASLGISAAAHSGPLVRTSWSSLVCFAGLGPGEVTVGGRKVVGISQRRTRGGALFQCAALLRWDVAALLDLLDMDPGDRVRAGSDLGSTAAGLDCEAADLTDAFLAALRSA